MAKIHFNISDNLDQEMRNYIEKNNLTITTFLHLAITKYLESQEQQQKIKKMFTELLNDELKKELKRKED